MKKSTFKLEKELCSQGYDLIIGIDEVGIGPLAGPVVACACAIKHDGTREDAIKKIEKLAKNKNYKLIKDSKKLSAPQRKKVLALIEKHFHIGIGICDHKTIDRINILQASFLAMKKAVGELKLNVQSCHSCPLRRSFSEASESRNLVHEQNSKTGSRVKPGMTKAKSIILVDGNKKIPNMTIEQRTIIGGDNLVKSISAASIVAKVTRDNIMDEMHLVYPEYYFNRHKGYGTRHHRELIAKHGPCQIHRFSYFPVKNWTKKGEKC